MAYSIAYSDLLILDGERLSYRNLDVEQIGSVYEAMMGFELQVADGPSIAIKPKKASGAPVTINLEELLEPSARQTQRVAKQSDRPEAHGQAERALKAAASIDDLMAAFDRQDRARTSRPPGSYRLHDLPAVTRTPPQRIPLHATLAHRSPSSKPPWRRC